MRNKLKQFRWMMVLAGMITSAIAQTVSIPDTGLDAAIRDALQKPGGALTEQDLLSLTHLEASSRNISSITGLENAHNLVSLNLARNHLTAFSVPAQLTNLITLDVSFNAITNFSVPNGPTTIATLNLADNQLLDLALAGNLEQLTSLNLEDNGFTVFNLPSSMTNLVNLDIGFNSITNCTLPNGLTNLETLIASGNLLTNFTFPADLTHLTSLDLHINGLTNFNLPAGLAALTNVDLNENELTSFDVPTGMTNLVLLDLSFNQLTDLTLPADLGNLADLNLNFNQFTNVNLPAGMSALKRLHLRANQFTDFTLRPDLGTLTYLDISECPLSNLILPTNLNHLDTLRLSKNNLATLVLPVGMTNLTGLNLSENQLTNLVLPPDLFQLQSLDLGGNELSSLTLPPGMTNLTGFFVTGNNLTSLTLPPDMAQVTALGFLANPLTTVVLSEPLATKLADTVTSLENQGVNVFTYPLAVQLVRTRQLIGAFQFAITGPPGDYTVFQSSNLTAWSVMRSVPNPLGAIVFTDGTANLSPQKFYRAVLQSPPATPANMVFIAPNTFMLGSPTNEVGHQSDESPQTLVTLSHGFWMAKYPVTQGEFLAVMGSNPSGFPGDLNRPVESVSWFDATNYCDKLTQQDLAAGRIPPGSHYRLPTEAEWECAARAGTSTRFYFGDDATSLTNDAWYSANSGFGTHPVGLKQANAWGLYDMEGDVSEWCQDWYGPYPGGSVIDPEGSASNPIGFKVVRGGGWDAFETDCRSARRDFRGASPFITDFILGFRVVLTLEP